MDKPPYLDPSELEERLHITETDPASPRTIYDKAVSANPYLRIMPPTQFPIHLLPPSNIPLRPEPQTKLQQLDEFYNKKAHPILNGYGLDKHIEDPEDDEHRSEAADKVLRDHLRDRKPYVKLASNRLQAIMGLRNELPFELPITPINSPTARNLFGGPLTSANANAHNRMDSGISVSSSPLASSSPIASSSPFAYTPSSASSTSTQDGIQGMHVVDKQTGKGLREFLLAKGRETGSTKKQECKSISFHAFVQDMRSGAHQEKLLANYVIQSDKDRIEFYEVDLPTIATNQETGNMVPTTETWVWLFIARPVLNLNPYAAGTSINVPAPRSNNEDNPFTYPPKPQSSTPLCAPPNFPNPIPESWLVIAAPKAHVTSYPPFTEQYNLESAPATVDIAHLFKTERTTLIHKRRDFDFAHSGMPLFEFHVPSIPSLLPNPRFLAVDLGGWDRNDEFWELDPQELEEMVRKWEVPSFVVGAAGTTAGGDADADGGKEVMRRGAWWRSFYERVRFERSRWMAIKLAMGRGKCRIVIRYQEDEEGGQKSTASTTAVPAAADLSNSEMQSDDRGQTRRQESGFGSGLGLNLPSMRDQNQSGFGGSGFGGSLFRGGLEDRGGGVQGLSGVAGRSASSDKTRGLGGNVITGRVGKGKQGGRRR